MHKDLEALCQALDELTAAILAGWSGDQTFLEAWGWNCPAVTRHDMAALSTQLAQDIRSVAADNIDDAALKAVQDFPRRLGILRSNTLPQFWGGNCGVATSVYVSTLETIRRLTVPSESVWQIPDPKTLPLQLARRLRAIQVELDQLIPSKDLLAGQIQHISQAHAVAESLQIDLADLAEARNRVVKFAAESATSAEKASKDASMAARDLEALGNLSGQAAKIVDQCEEAYRITTTKGLAAAFDQRATRLSWSMSAWVVFLLVALWLATKLGSARVELLSQSITTQNPNWGVICMHLFLSVLSIGAPIWFGWLATKQVGQRFRLAEDYAFKASVAKAYEGYRKEAARLDPALEARLFSSALNRLDEAPLRLVEQETHGSPWHEFFSSPQFQKALSSVPELKDKFFEVTRQGVDSATKLKTELKSP